MQIAENKERCVLLAAYMIENHATVRQTAAYFGISKSTVHKDIKFTLCKVNKALYYQSCELMEINKRERHIRGGEATRKKYQALKNIISTENIQ